MAKGFVVGLLAAFLVVSAVIGAVVGVVYNTKKAGSNFTTPSDKDSTISTTSKSLTALCMPALHKESCEQTLSEASANGSASPTQIFKTFADKTMKELETAFRRSASITVGKMIHSNDSRVAMAVSDCKKLLEESKDDMNGLKSIIGKDMQHLASESDNIKNSITAAMTFMDNCVDGFQDPELKSEMDSILSNATMLSSNALGVLTSITSFMEKLNLDLKNLPLNVPHRRLMGYDMDSQNYPTWLSAGDRKLLASEDRTRLKPNAVVAKDGSGNYKTINDALKGMPKEYKGRYVIYVKAGVYQETVTVTRDKANLYMYGDGSQKTRVVGHKSFADGLTTMDTATFSVEAPGFICKSMGFANTAGAERHQAVAFRITGDFGAFFNCRFDGYQDTLYTQARRQFFRNCVVSGTIDFIFGNAAVVFQNCLIIVRRPMDNQQNTVTAHGRKDPNQKTGIVVQNCRIVPDDRLSKDRLKIPSYLGRPWKEYSRTVIMESTIRDLIHPEGWMPWDKDFALKTLYYAEFANRGPGASTAHRVKWPGFRVINKNEAAKFTTGQFINGNMWLKYTGIPHLLGFKD